MNETNETKSVLRQNDEIVMKLFSKTLSPVVFANREQTEAHIKAELWKEAVWDASKVKLPMVGIDRDEAHFHGNGNVDLGYTMNIYTQYQSEMNAILEDIMNVCGSSGIRVVECKQKKGFTIGQELFAKRWKVKFIMGLE